MNVNDVRGMVSIQEACQIAGVSRRTIYNWMKTGKLETVRTVGGSVRIAPESLFRKEGAPMRTNVGEPS